MNVARAKPGAELGEEPLEIRARRAARTGTGRWYLPALMSADTEIRPDQDVNRRMLHAICGERSSKSKSVISSITG